MKVLRTPDERFASLPGYDFAPHYVEVPTATATAASASTTSTKARATPRPVLLLHGEPRGASSTAR